MKIMAQSLVSPKLPYFHLAYVSATFYKRELNLNSSSLIVALITLVVAIKLKRKKTKKSSKIGDVFLVLSLLIWCIVFLSFVIGVSGRTVYQYPDFITEEDMGVIRNAIMTNLKLGEVIPENLSSIKKKWDICREFDTPDLGKCIGRKIRDGWLNPMKLKKQIVEGKTHYVIVSAGEDGRFNTGDDLKATAYSDIKQTARERLRAHLVNAGFDSTPKRLALLAFKQEQMVEVWGKSESRWNKIKIYPFTATSGTLGPKLKQKDEQIPEGLYQITLLDMDGHGRLLIKINYPNTFDETMALKDGRKWDIGGDICFCGRDYPWWDYVGGIPVGDMAIEELFLLARDVGMEHVQVIIAPVDFRNGAAKPEIPEIVWEQVLYDEIEQALNPFTDKVPTT